MVKTNKNDIPKDEKSQWSLKNLSKPNKIDPSTIYCKTSESLSPFGGLLGLIKFLDLVKFQEIFDIFYKAPSRKPLLGHYNMMRGFLMLLFIGFNRVWHFKYIQKDSMLCAIFGVKVLPYVTTFWRYVDSLGINQAHSLLNVMGALRERVWQLCKINYEHIHIDIDPTVETVFGNQQGARKGHNTKHRGKEGYRPVLCFIEETREYIYGKLRTGKTMSGEDVYKLIRQLKNYLPGCVKKVTLRADSEMMNSESVKAAKLEGYSYIFANKKCEPPFKESGWYNLKESDKIDYNECMYQPIGWDAPCRFVVMRIKKEEATTEKAVQLKLIKSLTYKYRIFVTDKLKKPHKVILEYDKRADCENLIGESKREGLSAIPSRKFANNAAFFQIVMLSYNIWRSFKMLAGYSEVAKGESEKKSQQDELIKKTIVNNTIRIARLKLLLIAVKIIKHSGTNTVKFSEHDTRIGSLFRFYKYIDKERKKIRPWLINGLWQCKHMPYVLAQEATV